MADTNYDVKKMQELEEAFKRIKTDNGEMIRLNIVQILEHINSVGLNATTFSGYNESDLVKKDEIGVIFQGLLDKIKIDSGPDAESENLLATKGIMFIIGSLKSDNWPEIEQSSGS